MNSDYMNPMELVEKAKSLILHKAKIKDLVCNITIDGELSKEIKCDMRRLLQVILNLGFNAIKYTFKGSVTIKFTENRKKREFCVTISDTGIGITKKDLESINKLFGLMEKKLITNQTGIGLGLTISKNIISAMNGTLEITSELGIGTICRVCIPLPSCSRRNTLICPDDMSESISAMIKKTDPIFGFPNLQELKKPRVIVIDDEPFIQLALGTLLMKLGCNTDKASNGQLGVDMVNKNIVEGNPYDLIFIDANMPVMSGYEATKLMKENPKMTSPIVCVSAQDSMRHQQLCKEVGMNDIINKPCTINKLKEILIKYKLL